MAIPSISLCQSKFANETIKVNVKRLVALVQRGSLPSWPQGLLRDTVGQRVRVMGGGGRGVSG